MKRMSRDTKFVLGGAAVLAAIVAGIILYEKRAGAAPQPVYTPGQIPLTTCPPGQFLDSHGYCEDIAPPPPQTWPTLNWQATSQGPQPAPVITGNAQTIHVGQTINFTLPLQPGIQTNQSIAAPVVSGPTAPGPGPGGVNVGGYSRITGAAPGSCVVSITSGGVLWAQIALTVVP